MVFHMKKKYLCFMLFLLIISLTSHTLYSVRKIKNNSLDRLNIFLGSESYKISKLNLSEEHIKLILKYEKNKKINIDKASVNKIYFSNEKYNKITYIIFKKFIFNSLIEKPLKIDLFLNTAYFGKDIYGFYDASKHYFEKNIQEIDVNEFEKLLYLIVDKV